MLIRSKILFTLTRSPNQAVERVIDAALASAGPTEQRQLVTVLLERNQRAGWVALIRHFHRLADDLQHRVLGRSRELFGPLSEAMKETENHTRENVIAIIQRTGDAKLAFLIAQALTDPRPELRALAGETLLGCVRTWRHSLAIPDAGIQGDPAELRRAVETAFKSYNAHQDPNVLQSALMLERQTDTPFWSHYVLADNSHEAVHRHAGQLLRALPDADLVPAALLALASPLKPAAVAGIMACDDPAVASALARESYRLVDPVLAASARGVTHTKIFASEYADPAANPSTAADALGSLRLITRLGLSAQDEIVWLHRLVDADLPRTVAVAVKALVAQHLLARNHPDAGPLWLKLALDGDERIARVAARHLTARRQTPAASSAATAAYRELIPKLVKSPHASVRDMAAAVLAPGEFEKLWQDYRRLPPVVRNNATRQVAADTTFAARLREKLASAETDDLVQALRMIASAGNVAAYKESIIRLCGHPEPRVVAGAIRLIGRLEDDRFRDLLEAAAQHPDARVRANAIESMEQLHIAHTSTRLLELLDSRHSRERANAIKAISTFNFVTARECLAKMLNDPSPQHRMAALWVSSQLQLIDVVERLAQMARKDPHLKVRRKAMELVQYLQNVTTTLAGVS